MNILKSDFLSISLIFLLMQGCSVFRRAPDEAREEVYLDGLRHVQEFTVYGVDDYFATSLNEKEDKGSVARVKKGKVTPFPFKFQTPRGLGVDPRRGRLLVADGWTIHYLFIPDPEKNPKKLVFPEANRTPGGYLDTLYYSLMGRKAYFVVRGSEEIWSWDPVSGKSQKEIDRGEFLKAKGQIFSRIYVSVDGTNLTLGTRVQGSENQNGSLYSYNLPSKEWREIVQDQRWKNIRGIEYFNQHILLFDGEASQLWAIDMKDHSKIKNITPSDFIPRVRGFSMDLSSALVLPDVEGDQSVQFRKFKLPLRF